MGNVDDAISITIAVLIVLTGKTYSYLPSSSVLILLNSWICTGT